MSTEGARGRLYGVVGPSGVGKDTLMEAAQAARSDLHLVRRTITRAAGAGGEDFEAVSEAEFAARAAAGDFALHWQAHGLSYGIPATLHDQLAEGKSAMVNLSRGMLLAAAEAFPSFTVIHVTARPEVLAARLAARGRESAQDIAARLSRSAPALPAGLAIIEIDNSGDLDKAVEALLAALQPESAAR